MKKILALSCLFGITGGGMTLILYFNNGSVSKSIAIGGLVMAGISTILLTAHLLLYNARLTRNLKELTKMLKRANKNLDLFMKYD